ncbi:NAD(P)H-binding protein [Pseudonocardia cypriaca]|uniref:Uncharacterized protein YbjT (DUF2867 family) n=1 Tax=Pseudonocardia cypriaca TaxID=882449 RepID=A0A543FT63_9PSEU|nr:NAD(P)H-binding protein [Pseudonocardia cypriaca]TQM37039.1 uncharacterized protein YbjT (DUF2867 family) [Pseudonocardia cypriaca]
MRTTGSASAREDAPILVLGGTGRTGRRVADHLGRRGRRARVASRSGPVRFDWDDPGTWGPALAGVGGVYLMSAGAGEAVPAFLDVVRASGAPRVVLLSARAWERAGDGDLLAVERWVREHAPGWTILRPTWFAQNFDEEPFLRDMVATGTVTLSAGNGLVPFVDVEDVAEVAAAVLTEPGHVGRVYELSGPRLLGFGDAVGELARARGRSVRYDPVSSRRCAARLREIGCSAEVAAFVDRMLGWVAAGAEAHLSDGVHQVLGRQPRDFGEYLRRGRCLPGGRTQ